MRICRKGPQKREAFVGETKIVFRPFHDAPSQLKAYADLVVGTFEI